MPSFTTLFHCYYKDLIISKFFLENKASDFSIWTLPKECFSALSADKGHPYDQWDAFSYDPLTSTDKILIH